MVRKTILNYAYWDAIQEITRSAYYLDFRFNRDITEFSYALKIRTYKVLGTVQVDMLPNIKILKNKCLNLSNSSNDETSEETASTSKGAKAKISRPLPVTKIAGPLTLKCIMNWPNVLISLSLPGFQCMRQNLREVSYDLINNRNMESLIKAVPFNTKHALQIEKDFCTMGVDKRIVNECLQRLKTTIEKTMTINDKQIKDLNTVFSAFTFNLERGPSIVKPGEYKIFLNTIKYFRYLFKEVPEELVSPNFKNTYDVRMEEILSPAQIISYSHVLFNEMNKNYIFKNEMAWLKIHCLSCRLSFVIKNISFENVIWHFMDSHYDEYIEWTCSNCKQTFPAKYLMENGWLHKC